jgi:predicted Zn-dependent protease
MRMKFSLLGALAVTAVALASPAHAQQAPRAIAPAELQQAAQQHPQLVQQFGGEMKGPLADYVASVGRRLSGYTNVANAGSAYRVTLLNSPVRNAFAVPGGYVYVTRELLALMNSEDELAFVLGHEMGHVAARHGQKRQTRSTITGIGAAIAQVLTGSDLVGQVAGQVGQGLLLGYSRAQENESDTLGVRYIAAAGFDPFAAPRMLSAMGAAESLDAGVAGRQANQTPSWSRTHPLSAERVQRTRALAGQQRPAGMPSPQSRERFLAAIDGMTYGDDPSQGVVDGRQFRHPTLRFRFTAPQGYTIENGTSAVTVAGTGGQAQFGTGRLSGGLDGYVGQVFGTLAGGGGAVSLPAVQTTTVNGMPAAYATTRATASNRQVDVTVFAYRWSADTAYHFVAITPAGTGLGPFHELVGSLTPMTASEAATVKRRVIDVVSVSRADSLQSLAARMAFGDRQLERFQTLNGFDANTRLQPGGKVKLIVFAP